MLATTYLNIRIRDVLSFFAPLLIFEQLCILQRVINYVTLVIFFLLNIIKILQNQSKCFLFFQTTNNEPILIKFNVLLI